MMGKEENLGLPAQMAKDLKPSRCAAIIKINKQVVGDERKGVGALKIILDRGHSQRQIKLVGRSGTHPSRTDAQEETR
jgi:hypothetical protein